MSNGDTNCESRFLIRYNLSVNGTPIDQLIVGDCVETLSQFADNSIDLTVFSPPYDNIRTYNGDWAVDFTALGIELYRITKEGGVCAIVIGDGTKDFAKSLTTFRLAVDWCDNVGWRMFETCIYQRAGNPGAWWKQRFRVDHEYILIFFKGRRPKSFDKSHMMVPSKHAGKIYTGTDRLTNGGTKRIEPKAVNPFKCRGTIWSYSTSNSEGNKDKMKHPATFPDKLVSDIISCFSKPGDVVLDPFIGSGTTAVMARKTQRRYVGIDISESYIELSALRLRNETQRELVFNQDFAVSHDDLNEGESSNDSLSSCTKDDNKFRSTSALNRL